jgi:hypothetical protein
MRSGPLFESMGATFEGCAAAGAELLSIESVGGKEVHDDALMMCDLRGVLFGLCVLGVRDMRLLWTELARIARRHGVHAAGDTACGFANTAMVLAEQKMIPRVFAAVVRAVSAVRTLVGYECGAVGPGKDCGYENPILKAITGFPMAMEGKTAACAHLSPLGNIAAATCDTWSNESVQNIKLLGGMAPTCYLEQLIYDCRLMNEALADGREAALLYRKWMIASDVFRDPQAYVISPDSAVTIAQAIVAAPDHFQAGQAAARAALSLIRQGHRDGSLKLVSREVPWLDRIERMLDTVPADETTFVAQMLGELDRYRAHLSSLPNTEFLATPSIPHSELVKRALRRRKPFSERGTGYRDSLIWITVLALLRRSEETVAFVTANSADFAAGKALHPHLLEDVCAQGTASTQLLFFESLDHLNKRLFCRSLVSSTTFTSGFAPMNGAIFVSESGCLEISADCCYTAGMEVLSRHLPTKVRRSRIHPSCGYGILKYLTCAKFPTERSSCGVTFKSISKSHCE